MAPVFAITNVDSCEGSEGGGETILNERSNRNQNSVVR